MDSSVFKDFTRGGQTIMHSLRMFSQAMRSIILIVMSVWIITVFIFAFIKTNAYDRYIFSEYLCAQLKLVLQDKYALHEIKTSNGQVVKLKAINFVHHPKTLRCLNRVLIAVETSILNALWAGLVCLFCSAGFFFIKGKAQRTTTELRGGIKAEPKILIMTLIHAKKASEFKLATVPLVKETEVQHLLLTGTTGTGKSVCMQELMDQVRKKGQRAIVYDIEGSFIPHYYRPDKDIILNPFDDRSPAWNIWQECKDAADFEAVASSLMPMHLSGTDPFWIHSGRSIFAAAALKLQLLGKCQNKELLGPMFSDNLGSLSSLLAGSVAETLVSDKNEKTALCIKATLSTYCKALTYLREDITGSLFSIRRWLEADKGDSWLFIASNSLKIDAVKPLLSIWLDVAAKSILALPQSATRRIWFFLDELATLHRLPSFINSLSRCRKYGGCYVAAIQDMNQLRAVYGRDEAETLIALFNTHLCFRTSAPDSAAWMSKIMGYREIIEHKEGLSYGANDIRDSVSIHQDRRKESIVMDSEFLELENLNAYLKLPGAWPITKLQFEPKKRSHYQPALVERVLKESILLKGITLPKEVISESEENNERTLIEKNKLESVLDLIDS